MNSRAFITVKRLWKAGQNDRKKFELMPPPERHCGTCLAGAFRLNRSDWLASSLELKEFFETAGIFGIRKIKN